MKKGVTLLIIFAICLLFVFAGQNIVFPAPLLAAAKSAVPPKAAPPAAKEPQRQGVEKSSADLPPDFTLASLGKGSVTLSHLKGKKGVVLIFGATWCVNCVREMPEVKKFAEKAQKENVVVFGLFYKQPAEIVARFAKSQKINYGILLDLDGTVAEEKYGLRGIPHCVGINGAGRIIYRGTSLPDNKAEFIKDLKQGLRETI